MSAPLRIIAGRQEPVHGSKRDRRMTLVKAYLLSHPRGATYEGIGIAVGLSTSAAQCAVGDIKRFDPDLVVAIPTVRSSWRASLRWRDILHGQVNEAKQIMTRCQSQANTNRKIAASGKFPPHISQMYLAAAAASDAQAAQQASNIAMYEMSRPQTSRP